MLQLGFYDLRNMSPTHLWRSVTGPAKRLRCSPDSLLQIEQGHQTNACHCKPITPSCHAFGFDQD